MTVHVTVYLTATNEVTYPRPQRRNVFQRTTITISRTFKLNILELRFLQIVYSLHVITVIIYFFATSLETVAAAFIISST